MNGCLIRNFKNLSFFRIITLMVGVVMLFSSLFGCTKSYDVSGLVHFYYNYSDGYKMSVCYTFNLDVKDGKNVVNVKQDGAYFEEKEVEFYVEEDFVQKLEKILSTYSVGDWNGYDKIDKSVLDGDSFDIYITNNKGKHFEARGYMKWPENYDRVKTEVTALFTNAMEEYEESLREK